MKIQSKQITCYIGFAYLTLAFTSLVTDVPTRVVNCISLGALCISIAELILAIGELKQLKEPLISAKDLEKTTSQVELASMFLRKTLAERNRGCKPNRVVIVLVGFIYSFSFVFTIAWANIGTYAFLEMNKIGTFCSVASLGIILLSRFVSEWKDERVECDKELALYDSFGFYIDSLSRAIDKYNEKLNGIEHAKHDADNLAEDGGEGERKNIAQKRKKKKH